MSIYNQITDGDTAIAVVYRLMDVDGRAWRSSPYVLKDCLYWNADSAIGDTACDHRVRIPTLRHLMAGTIAQIELYIGNVDRQLFQVYENDPTVHYIDVFPKEIQSGAWAGGFTYIEEAVTYVGTGETLYTTGGALENAPPPISRCAYEWRNRVFVAHENTVWPSQEFSDGFGIAWNEATRIKWDDGTGDILAIGHIDWNYLAVFKKDAIGIISGPGPDGMGQGNYIVQTLSTKAGCTNLKSIVNGADGLYYQDSQTGRLMLLGPNLQAQECAPGAFDYSASKITCAMHVEQARQIWFFASTPTNRLIVLDYKHRTETSPAGSVYIWSAPATWAVSAMAVIRGVPHIMIDDGSICAQVPEQYKDVTVDHGDFTIEMELITADHNPIGLQRQFALRQAQFIGEYVSPHRLTVNLTRDFGASVSQHEKVMSEAPEQLSCVPANFMRAQAVSVRIKETSITGGEPATPVHGAGFKFVGFALSVQDYGKIANLPTTRIV